MSPNDYNYCGEVLRTMSATGEEEDVCIIDLFPFIVQWYFADASRQLPMMMLLKDELR